MKIVVFYFMRFLRLLIIFIISIAFMNFLRDPDSLAWAILLVIFLFGYLSQIDLQSGLVCFIFIFPLLTLLPEQLRGIPFSLATILFFCIFGVTLFKEKKIQFCKTSLDTPLLSLMVITILSAIVTILRLSYAPLRFVILKLIDSLQYIFLTFPEDRFDSAIHNSSVILIGILFFYYLSSQIKENGKLRDRVLSAFLLSSGIIGFYGLIQFIFGWNLLEYWKIISPNLTRINSTFTDPNAYGAYLVLVLPVTLVYSIESQGIKKWKYILLCFLLLSNLLCTASRSAWFSFILSLVFLLLVLAFTKIRDNIPSKFIQQHFKAMAFIILAIILFCVVSGNFITKPSYISDFRKHKSYWDVFLFSTNVQSNPDLILKNRLPLWYAAINMWKYQPWTGIGIGSYSFWVENFVPQGSYLFMRIINAHNYYLQLLAELGLIGFVLFLWTIQIIFRKGWNAVRFSGLVPLGLLSGIIAFLFSLFTQHALLQMEFQFLFWTVVILLFSYAPVSPSPSKRGRMNVVIVCFILALGGHLYNQFWKSPQRQDLDYSVGMYKVEKDNQGHLLQWTSKLAYLKKVINDNSLILPIFVNYPDIIKHPVTVQIYVDRKKMDTFKLNQTGWSYHPYTLSVPDTFHRDSTRQVVLTILVDPTWSAWKQNGEAVNWDYRRMGVALGSSDMLPSFIPVDNLMLKWGTKESRPYLAGGWSGDELSSDGTTKFVWSQGSQSEVFLPLKTDKSYKLQFRMLPFAYPNAPPQTVKFYMNKKFLGSFTLQNEWEWQDITIPLPMTDLNPRNNILELEYSRALAPVKVMPDNPDTREIAIAFDSLSVTPE